MHRIYVYNLLFLLTISYRISFAQPEKFISTGIGGGGGLFSPSINPAMEDEYYVCCDLGALYHTLNDGRGYENVHFTQVVVDIFGKLAFTSNLDIRYILKWDEDNYATNPARSTDGGKSWSFFQGDSEKDESKLFLYADYDHPQRVIWCTYGNISISMDGGMTDHLLYSAQTGAGVLLSGVFFMGDTIYLGTNDGVLISTDGGKTVQNAGFTGIPSDERIVGFGVGKNGDVMRFFALTGGAGDVWAGHLGPEYWGLIRGVYTMEDARGVWKRNMTGINPDKHYAVYLRMAENDPNTCYLAGAVTEPYTKPLVMKTSDGGKHWSEVFITDNNSNIYTGYQGYHGDLDYWWGEFTEGFTVNPHNSSQAILTDLGFIHETRDGGMNWHQKYLSPGDENPKGLPTPKHKYYQGVGLQQTSVWQVYWFDPLQMFGCFTDIKGVRSVDGGDKWSFDYTGHNLNTMYHIVKHRTEDLWFGATSGTHDMYETTFITDARLGRSGRKGKLLYSQDKGKSWKTMRDFGTPVLWVETSPLDPDVVYVSVVSPDAKGGIWKARGLSHPEDAIWTKLSNPPGANVGRPNNIRILNDGTLVVSWGPRKADNSSTFYPGSGVFVSTNDGASWQDMSHSDMKYWTQDIVIDPFDVQQNTWYACVWSGWGGPANDKGKLWRTKDRGKNWEPMTAPVQFHRVYSVAVDPLDEETMYLTTETEGLWVTHNKSAANPEWILVHAYHYHAPRRVFFNPFNQRDIWVSSFGNGMMHGELTNSVTKPNIAGAFSLFPNPISLRRGVIGLEIPDGPFSYEMLNSKGEIKQKGAGRNRRIPLRISTPGVYLLHVEMPHQRFSRKLIVTE